MIGISDTDLGKPLSAQEITPCRRAQPVQEKKIKRRRTGLFTGDGVCSLWGRWTS